jgi:chromosome partitioning protein
MARRIAIINQKGGCGKTTTTVNLGAHLSGLGKRVLLIDLDPQANLSMHVNIGVAGLKASVYNLLTGPESVEEVVAGGLSCGMDVVPSHIDLAGAELELAGTVGRETILKEKLDQFLARREAGPEPGYDFVLLDCPPSLGLLSINALTASHEVFIPLQTEFFALQGMTKLLDVVQLVRLRLNRSLQLGGIIPCLFDPRTLLSREVLSEIQRHYGRQVFRSVIRKNVKLAEAPSHGRTILEYAPESHGAADYRALAREVLGLPPEMEVPDPAPAEAAETPGAARPAFVDPAGGAPLPVGEDAAAAPPPAPEPKTPVSP